MERVAKPSQVTTTFILSFCTPDGAMKISLLREEREEDERKGRRMRGGRKGIRECRDPLCRYSSFKARKRWGPVNRVEWSHSQHP